MGRRARLYKYSSPPRLNKEPVTPPPIPNRDAMAGAKAKPAKKSFVHRLGQLGLGILGLAGGLLGTAGAVTAVQHYRIATETCPCPTVNLEKPHFDGDVQKYSDALVRQSLEKSGCNVRSRHEVGRLLQSENGQVRYDGSKVVLIAFDGTFSYQPRRTPVMQELARTLQDEGFDTTSKDFRPTDIVNRSITTVTGEDTRWSGLGHGIFQEILRDPELNQNIQLLSFPSEEIEVLSGAEAWKDIMPFEMAGEIYRSATDRPQNVENAIQAVVDIQRQAAEQGLSPRFVVLSHSSGGTTAVKFAERLRATLGDEVRLDFVATLDPVKEAHFAAGEAMGELAQGGIGRALDKVAGWVGNDRSTAHTPAIRSESQPNSLYVTGNANEWINFYQSNDILGIKTGPQVGIQGSPVKNAENIPMDDLGDGGHGAIAIDRRVLDRLVQELRERVREETPNG